MPTMRTPINRPIKTKISSNAIDAFQKILQLEQRCRCNQNIIKPCRACEQASEQHSILHRELKLPPWEFAIADPHEPSPYTGQSAGAFSWPAAQQRWRMLAAAAGLEIEEDA